MSSLVNLHTHSNLSDGDESPREVVRLAAESGTQIMALTDHDMTSGVLDAIDEGNKLGVNVIPGAEISSRYHDVTIHILGYNIDIANTALQNLLSHLRDFRREHMIERMEEISPELVGEFIQEQGEYFCPPKTAKFLVERGLAADPTTAWKMIKGVPVAARDVEPQHVIEAIHNAHGIAVLAHPFGPFIGISSISQDPDEQRSLIKTLKDQGLNGLECYQLSHHDEDIQNALHVADELGLMVTAGSDWHGPLSAKSGNIKNMVPNYKEHFEDFTVPNAEAMKIITAITSLIPTDRLK